MVLSASVGRPAFFQCLAEDPQADARAARHLPEHAPQRLGRLGVLHVLVPRLVGLHTHAAGTIEHDGDGAVAGAEAFLDVGGARTATLPMRGIGSSARMLSASGNRSTGVGFVRRWPR